eukprot:s2243_g5.t1
MQEWLGERIAADVPGDGNCAIWSVLALMHDDPFIEPCPNANIQMRREIAAHWISVSDDASWQQVYSRIVNLFDRNPSDESDEVEIMSEQIMDPLQSQVPKKEPKGEPKSERSSPQRRRPNKPVFIDLCSPPKKQGIQQEPEKSQAKDAEPAKRQPEVVGASRPAFHRKALLEEAKPVEHLDQRAQASRKLGQVLDDDPDAEDDGGQDDGGQDEPENADESLKPAKKRRKRTCKIKQPTLEDRKVAAAKAYLGSLGITWQVHKGFHSRFAVASSEYKCVEYKKMMNGLLEGKLPTCLTCVSMLKQHRFDMDTLLGRLEEIAADPSLPSPATQQIASLLGHLAGAEAAPLDGQVALLAIQDAPAADGDEDQAGAEVEEDLDEVLRKAKFFEILERGAHDKRVPIRCKLCKMSGSQDSKVFEGHKLRANTVRNFIRQHCRGEGHISAVAAFVRGQEPEVAPLADAVQMTPCEGVSVTHGKHRASRFKHEIILWAKHTKLGTALAKNTYTFDLAREELKVKHASCEKMTADVVSESPCCESCQRSDAVMNTLRSAIRFAFKHWAARILHAKLFMNSDEVLESFRETAVFNSESDKGKDLLDMDLEALQKYVRGAWVRTPKEFFTDVATYFFGSVVQPCLSVNVHDCNGELRKMACQFTADLACGRLSELGQLSARIAKASCDGRLSGNPAVMGLILQAIDRLERDSRGVESLKGVRKMSDLERSMVSEAGLLLASNSCNREMMKELGFNKDRVLRNHSRVDSLLADSLPCPALALMHPNVLDTNLTLIDPLEPRCPDFCQKDRFVVCMDFTYLLPMRTSMILHSARGMVGGAFTLDDCTQEKPGCFQDVGDKQGRDNRLKANRMLELLMWDPSSGQKRFWTPMSLPINLKALNSESTDSSFDPEFANGS